MICTLATTSHENHLPAINKPACQRLVLGYTVCMPLLTILNNTLSSLLISHSYEPLLVIIQTSHHPSPPLFSMIQHNSSLFTITYHYEPLCLPAFYHYPLSTILNTSSLFTISHYYHDQLLSITFGNFWQKVTWAAEAYYQSLSSLIIHSSPLHQPSL